MSWTNQTPNSASYTNQDKTDVQEAGLFDVGTFDEARFDVTTRQIERDWTNYIKRGKADTTGELSSYTFNDEILVTDETMEDDVTFDELEATSWSNQSKS